MIDAHVHLEKGDYSVEWIEQSPEHEIDIVVAKYKGNYIAEMRKDVGHAPLMVINCGVIIENDKGEILLQKRRDNGLWALIGGSMEMVRNL